MSASTYNNFESSEEEQLKKDTSKVDCVQAPEGG